MAFGKWVAALFCIVAATAPGAAQTRHAPIPAAKAKAGQFVDLTPEFVAFIDQSATLADDVRVKAFHDRFDPLLPGYFNGKDDQAAFDRGIIKRLKAFPEQRAKFLATASEFRAAFARGEQHFRQFFPDYRLRLPVYLVHSMGMQDGGTRDIGKRTVLFFGADVIAQIHDQQTIGPFLDHELFHAYHGQYFKECDQVWCSLWEEGLAVYAASQMTPGATDRQLLLDLPQPIRPAVTPRLGEAMCRLRERLQSTKSDDYAELFFGRPNTGPFPPRYGYLLGLLVVQKVADGRTLSTLAKLPTDQVKPLVEQAVASFGDCPAAAPAG